MHRFFFFFLRKQRIDIILQQHAFNCGGIRGLQILSERRLNRLPLESPS